MLPDQAARRAPQGRADDRNNHHQRVDDGRLFGREEQPRRNRRQRQPPELFAFGIPPCAYDDAQRETAERHFVNEVAREIDQAG